MSVQQLNGSNFATTQRAVCTREIQLTSGAVSHCGGLDADLVHSRKLLDVAKQLGEFGFVEVPRRHLGHGGWG